MTWGTRPTPEEPQDDVDARFRDIVARFGEPPGPDHGDAGGPIGTAPQGDPAAAGADAGRGDRPGGHPHSPAGDTVAGADEGSDADAAECDDARDDDARPATGRGVSSGSDSALGTGSVSGLGPGWGQPGRVNHPLGPAGPTPWRVHHPPPDPDDEHFVPPRPAPPPGHDAVFWTALVGCVAGPMWFLYLVLTDPYGSRLGLWAAGLLTLCGCALTVWRLPKRSETDPDDDGARV